MKYVENLNENTNQKGVWLIKEDDNTPLPKANDSDAHIYVSSDYIVLGQNFSYSDDVVFTDLAVILDKDGVRVQWADEHGDYRFRKLDNGVFYKLLLRFLENCKNYSNY